MVDRPDVRVMKGVPSMRTVNQFLTRLFLPVLLSVASAVPCRAAEATLYSVGVAKVDVTPDYPVRLSGYGGRERESEGIDQHIFAKALAIKTASIRRLLVAR